MSLDPMPSAAELRAMAAKRGVLPQNGPTQPAKARKAPSVRPWGRYRSKWELEYSKHLDVLKAVGRVVAWAYEPDRLEIGVGAVYTPDFWVNLPNGSNEYREVKGHRREASIVRIKAAAKQYPDSRFILVTKKGGAWVHTPIGAK